MPAKIQAIRGMRDILPEYSGLWRYIENQIIEIISQYGYQEIRLPVLEKTELFTRTIGEDTDIVTKEMYTFQDRNGEQITLRPEGTAGCVRACLEHGLLHNQIQKLWYRGPMFRHERPQMGRQRQFYQIGVEAYGIPGPDIDAEMIILCTRIWQSLGLKNIQLEINTLGTEDERQSFLDELTGYFSDYKDQLDEDSLRRLEKNPLRILDSKNPEMQQLINKAPSIQDHLGKNSLQHFKTLCQLLDHAGINYTINPHLVRGLDYYGLTVFEWITDELGAQGSVCAGGRYDKLVSYFANKSVPAVGFALGMERLITLLVEKADQLMKDTPHVYLILADEKTVATGLAIAETLRNHIKQIRVQTHCGGGSIKSQFKKADKSGAEFALILGQEEYDNNAITIKPLRSDDPQFSIPQDKLCDKLVTLLSRN